MDYRHNNSVAHDKDTICPFMKGPCIFEKCKFYLTDLGTKNDDCFIWFLGMTYKWTLPEEED